MTNFRLFQTQSFLLTTILDLMKMAESLQKKKKKKETLWEKEKLLITSNFSISQAFKRLVLQTRKGLVWERVNISTYLSNEKKIELLFDTIPW